VEGEKVEVLSLKIGREKKGLTMEGGYLLRYITLYNFILYIRLLIYIYIIDITLYRNFYYVISIIIKFINEFI